MNRIPFDCDALREWTNVDLSDLHDDRYLLERYWQQMRADLLAAADEIELLMAERVKEKAA